MSDLDERLAHDRRWQGLVQAAQDQLGQMRAYLQAHYPDLSASEMRAYLETAIPNAPASTRGRPKGSHMSDAEFVTHITHAMQKIIKRGDPCNEEKIIEELGWSNTKKITRRVKRLGFHDFEAFKKSVLPRFPVLYLSVAYMVCPIDTSVSVEKGEGSDGHHQG